MHPVKNLVILYTLYDHLVTKRFTLSALRNLHLHRQLRLGERIRFRHRGTFQQVSIGMTISRSPPTTSHITVSITTMIYYLTTTPLKVHEPRPQARRKELSSEVSAAVFQGGVQIWERAENQGGDSRLFEFLRFSTLMITTGWFPGLVHSWWR